MLNGGLFLWLLGILLPSRVGSINAFKIYCIILYYIIRLRIYNMNTCMPLEHASPTHFLSHFVGGTARPNTPHIAQHSSLTRRYSKARVLDTPEIAQPSQPCLFFAAQPGPVRSRSASSPWQGLAGILT